MNYIIGHKNPDTDSIMSAIVFQDFLKKIGKQAIAARQGDLNPESQWALKQFGLEEPVLVSYNTEDFYYLVDHNSYAQSITGLKEDQILGVIDHHKIALTTSKPIYFRVEPVGCTCTLLYKMYKENNLEISKKIAGAMLCAILSDTVIFKSATTTEEDKKVAKELARMLDIKDIFAFGLELKKQNTNVSNLSEREIITRDLKEFSKDGIKFATGQVEVIGEDILSRKKELLNEMEKIRQEKDYKFLILLITDIIKEGSYLLIVGDKTIPSRAFGEFKDNMLWLDGVMSRKKQVIPPIINQI